MIKQCDKCGLPRDSLIDFETEKDEICNYCKGEMGVLDGKIITKDNLGEIMQERFQEREQ